MSAQRKTKPKANLALDSIASSNVRREVFAQNPQLALQKAEALGGVAIIDSSGRAHAYISVPSDDDSEGGLAGELADARAEVARLREALNLSLHAFRSQLSHGQRKGLAYGELTCLIALGVETEHGRMGNCLTLGEETEHRKRIALSALDAKIGET